jgi:hypothetical protein
LTEFFESFMMGDVHTPDDPKFPFCPKQLNTEHYRSFGGEDHDGGKLGDLINRPQSFGASIEASARPKDSKSGKDDRQNHEFADTIGEKLTEVKGDDLD